MYVCMYVCMYVTLRGPPLVSETACTGLIGTFLFGSGLKSPKKRADFALQNMEETTLPVGLETFGQRRIANFGIFLDIYLFF